MQPHNTIDTVSDTVPVSPEAGAPAHTPSAPMHTQTQSTLSPTSEYVRYLLLFLPARYIPRGIFGTL
jgi:hypothetical protein